MILSKGKILVKPSKYNTTTETGLFYNSKYKRLSYKGEVIAVSDFEDECDSCKVGDVIIYDRYIGYDVTLDDQKYEVIDQTDIVCIVEKGIYQIPYNYVLVRKTTDNSKTADGNFYIDKSYQKEKHALTFAQVVTPPSKLLYLGDILAERELITDELTVKLNNVSLKWRRENSDVLIQYGDIIHFHYLSIQHAEVSGYVIKDEITGEDLYLIRYDLCYAFEREERIEFLNGYCGVDIDAIPTSEETETGIIKVNLDDKNKKNWGYGRIVFMAEPNVEYAHYDVDETKIDVKVGDFINFTKTKKMQIGNNILLKTDKLKNMHLIQRKDINFVIVNN